MESKPTFPSTQEKGTTVRVSLFSKEKVVVIPILGCLALSLSLTYKSTRDISPLAHSV